MYVCSVFFFSFIRMFSLAQQVDVISKAINKTLYIFSLGIVSYLSVVDLHDHWYCLRPFETTSNIFNNSPHLFSADSSIKQEAGDPDISQKLQETSQLLNDLEKTQYERLSQASSQLPHNNKPSQKEIQLGTILVLRYTE